MDLEIRTALPTDVTFTHGSDQVTVKGPKGELSRRFRGKGFVFTAKDGELTITCKGATQREKRLVNTLLAHIKNMILGVQEGFVYKLKICSGHFPMTVAIKNNMFEIKNFIGEKVPRTLVIKEGAEVKINGDEIIVTAVDKEVAGQVAADIEKLTKRPGFDKRTFQDGIYITSKAGKAI